VRRPIRAVRNFDTADIARDTWDRGFVWKKQGAQRLVSLI
jgi:hypothetical protein